MTHANERQTKKRRLPAAPAPFNAAERLAILQEEELKERIASLKAKRENDAKESTARIAALEAAKTQPTSNIRMDGSLGLSQTGKLADEALVVSRLHPGIDKTEVGRIFDNTFNPYNLYKLRRNIIDTRTEHQSKIVIAKDEGIIFEKAVSKLKDYNNNTAIWSEYFLVYTSIMVSFFGTKHPNLHRALIDFHGSIIFLATIYK